VANVFQNPEVIAAQALGLLQREIVLPRLVTRKGLTDFAGAKDFTVNMRVPASLTARTRDIDATAVLVADDVSESVVPVVLDTQVYHLANVTDAELSLSIADFGQQVQMPQMRAVAEELENLCATALAGADWEAEDIVIDTTDDDAWGVLVEARRVLNTLKVPRAGRVLAVGGNVEAFLLDHEKFVKVNESGSGDALREASLGRILGFEIVGTEAIDPDTAFAFHASAICLGVAAPVVPRGATAGASADYQGLAMTWLNDYDPMYSRDRSLVHAFAGATSVEEGEDTKNFRGVPLVISGS
jgi:hypothetical protein